MKILKQVCLSFVVAMLMATTAFANNSEAEYKAQMLQAKAASKRRLKSRIKQKQKCIIHFGNGFIGDISSLIWLVQHLFILRGVTVESSFKLFIDNICYKHHQ